MNVTVNESTNTVTVSQAGASLGNGLTGGLSAGQTLAVSLTNASSTLGSATAFTTSWADLLTLSSLTAGKYLVTATVSVGASNLAAALSASRTFAVRLIDSAGSPTVYASAHGVVLTNATPGLQLATISLSANVTLASTLNLKLQVIGSGTDIGAYHQEQGSGGAIGSATRINAIKFSS